MEQWSSVKPIPASRWEELKRLEEALSFSTEGDRDDEHVRYRVFQEAVPRLNLGGVAEAFFAALAADPDRAMASGVAGLILLPGVPAQLASATEQAVADSKWVGRRIKELDLYDRCLPSSASDFQAALADASGWLDGLTTHLRDG